MKASVVYSEYGTGIRVPIWHYFKKGMKITIQRNLMERELMLLRSCN